MAIGGGIFKKRKRFPGKNNTEKRKIFLGKGGQYNTCALYEEAVGMHRSFVDQRGEGHDGAESVLNQCGSRRPHLIGKRFDNSGTNGTANIASVTTPRA